MVQIKLQICKLWRNSTSVHVHIHDTHESVPSVMSVTVQILLWVMKRVLCEYVCVSTITVLVLRSSTLPFRAAEPGTSQSGTDRVEPLKLTSDQDDLSRQPHHGQLHIWPRSQISSSSRHAPPNHCLRIISWHSDLFFFWGRSHEGAICTAILVGQW